MVNYYRITIPWLKVMRISTLILCMQLLVLTLLQAHESVAQTINIKADRASLRDVFKQIEKQANVTFAYKVETIQQAPPVTLVIENQSLKETLRVLGKETKLTFEQVGNLVAVKKMQIPETPKKETPAPNLIAEPKQDNLRGRVTDSAGTPLIGVTVRINETNQTTVTNGDGYFEFTQVADDATFTFSFVGFQSKVVSIHNLKSPIVLAYYNSELTEVEVNAGYWKVNDKLRTGNISRVDGETIRQQPVIDPMLALSGRVPGLQISQNSGLPGAYHNVRIRGTNSIANGNSPFFIIDGIPFDSGPITNPRIAGSATNISPFSLINADEIESIEVLKDADATAIYGSRGANGVILITTKKGHSGKTSINVNVYTGLGEVPKTLDLLKTEQYLEMRREAFENDGIAEYPTSAYDVNGTWETDRYTDWQKVLIGNNSHMSNMQAQISGGSEYTQFTLGGGITNESTVFPGDYKTRRTSSNISINHRSPNKKIGISISARYSMNINDQPQTDFSINNIRLAPNAPSLYNEDGKLNWENDTWQNPLAETQKRSKLNAKNLITNGAITYQVVKPLDLKLNFGYLERSSLQSNITPLSAYSPSWSIYPSIRSHTRSESRQNTWLLEPQLNFRKNLYNGVLQATIGSTFQKTGLNTLAQTGTDFAEDALIENLMAAVNIRIIENRQTEYMYAALFGRINYNWKDKYLINFVARRDGSTRFAPERQYGNFVSIGGSWIFSNEPIFKNSALSFGKLRTSYGITGNDQLGDYQYLSTYSVYNYPYLGITGLSPTRLYSPDYGWEAVKKTEVALDLAFWEDRLKLSTTFYLNRTDNQLVGYPLPTMTGFSSIQGNLPAVIENKGWEIELNTANISNKQFTWNTIFNISVPKNRLIAYPDIEKSSYRNTYEVGSPLSIQKLWHWTGVDPQTGIHTFEDADKDGQISSPQDLHAYVNTAQLYFGGLLNNLTFHNFQLDIFFQFVKQQGKILVTSVPGAFVNQETWVLDRWRKPGDITKVQRFTQSGPALMTMVDGINESDMVFDDASFIRCKNVAFSYQLPTTWLRIIKIQQCRLFAQGQNLFTISNYKGLDPETQIALAPIRMLTAGINLTF